MIVDPDAEHYFVQRHPDGSTSAVRLDIEHLQVRQSTRFERPRFEMTGWYDGGGVIPGDPMRVQSRVLQIEEGTAS